MGVSVLEEAKQPELFAAWPGRPNLVVAPHFAMHCLPLTPTRELRRWGLGNGVKRGFDPRANFHWTGRKKRISWHAPIGLLVKDDVPGRRGRRRASLRRPPRFVVRDDSNLRTKSCGERGDGL